jgi:hypothetical protein
MTQLPTKLLDLILEFLNHATGSLIIDICTSLDLLDRGGEIQSMEGVIEVALQWRDGCHQCGAGVSY